MLFLTYVSKSHILSDCCFSAFLMAFLKRKLFEKTIKTALKQQNDE